MIISARAFWTLLLTTLLIAFFNAYWVPMHPDEPYYWQWSRHLALSYYDGPPLMAYLIRAVTTFVGNSVFGVKLTAVLCTSTGVFFVYQLARVMFDERVAYTSLLLIMLMPITQAWYSFSLLDPALFCFWSVTLFCFYMAVATDNTKYRYLAAVFLGLAVLAKYPGVLLGVSLFIYLIISNTYRKEFKNIHWYVGVIIALLIVSPVFIWNWQHDFTSFVYQYNHGIAKEKIFQWRLMLAFIGGQIGVVNPLFFIGVCYSARYWREIVRNQKLLYLTVPFLVTFLFFLYEGMYKKSQAQWPSCAYISITILLAYVIVHYHKQKFYLSLLISNVVLLIALRCVVLTPFTAFSKYLWDPKLIAQANAAFHKKEVIISDHYVSASLFAFFLKDQPQVYILDDTQEYQYWSAPILEKIRTGEISSVVFMGSPDNLQRVTPFFKHKKLTQEIPYRQYQKQRVVSIYKLWS